MASLQSAYRSAPVYVKGSRLATFRKLTSGASVKFRVKALRIVSCRSRAGSRRSGLLVAPMTNTPPAFDGELELPSALLSLLEPPPLDIPSSSARS
ncbi:hypothetical protein KCU88_g441, partial [Aureobasidium melanogenum]